MGCYSIAGLPSAVRQYSFVHLDGERCCQSNLSCPRTQDDDSGQGAKQDRSFVKRVTTLTRRPTRLHNCASNCACLNKYPVTALDIVSITLEFKELKSFSILLHMQDLFICCIILLLNVLSNVKFLVRDAFVYWATVSLVFQKYPLRKNIINDNFFISYS